MIKRFKITNMPEVVEVLTLSELSKLSSEDLVVFRVKAGCDEELADTIEILGVLAEQNGFSGRFFVMTQEVSIAEAIRELEDEEKLIEKLKEAKNDNNHPDPR